MLIAGEASGDWLAADLVRALRPVLSHGDAGPSADLQPLTSALEPSFFGAGGPRMREAGVELAVDLTQHAVFGFVEVLRRVVEFGRLFRQLLRLALARQPDVLVLVDYAGFNRRFAAAVRRRAQAGHGPFNNWQPRLVYFVSPQVWASRAGRAQQLARDVDLLLSIFPFEKAWYARRVPGFRVEFVGHPIVDRYHDLPERVEPSPVETSLPLVLLLPGSRRQEVRHHLPILVEAARLVRERQPVKLRMVLPDPDLADLARRLMPASSDLELGVGNLSESLRAAALAVASSGTVTLECAFFRVPTVVIYRTSWPTYWIARRIVQVSHMAMPNLLTRDRVYPELLQGDATAQNIAREALDLLAGTARRRSMQQQLDGVIRSLGGPGACERAAGLIANLLRAGSP